MSQSSQSSFRPAWWARGGHLQTLWPAICRRRVAVTTWCEVVELDDGDCLELEWVEPDGKQADRPILIVLHGLAGSARSRYARGMLAATVRHGWRGVVMQFRGCGTNPNRLPRSYHSGVSDDSEQVVRLLRTREPDTKLAAVGYSLGGNVLLKWLGERGVAAPLAAAVAVSVPYDLAATAACVERGLSQLYQWHLMRSLKQTVQAKLRQDPTLLPMDERQVMRLRTFRQFDDQVTAPLHEFKGADDYYQQCSSGQFLDRITVPTLLVHARNDPMTGDVLPDPSQLPTAVRLELLDDGGHVGFVTGRWPWRATYWLEQRVPAFLQPYLESEDVTMNPSHPLHRQPHRTSKSV
ncbi:hydrolase [Phycisphaerales bacterium AB-hyl4]|uniref:Hydrolase n=1 Tax=Natronomicrosphaera hydrolytica TaxID=3242702 RepID=A0ABV4UBI3_9BACT